MHFAIDICTIPALSLRYLGGYHQKGKGSSSNAQGDDETKQKGGQRGSGVAGHGDGCGGRRVRVGVREARGGGRGVGAGHGRWERRGRRGHGGDERRGGGRGDDGGLHAHAALVAVAQEAADEEMRARLRQIHHVVPRFVLRDGVQAVACCVVRLAHFLHVVCTRQILEHCCPHPRRINSALFLPTFKIFY